MTDTLDMEKINRYTRRTFTPEEVYCFSLVLCDNEVDRDFERFSVPALEKLGALFLGKTCILDHERKSANQTARIFDTALEQEPGKITEAGEPYTRLTARAYLPKTARNEETVQLIESGILKEVSISCKMNRRTCSVCGRENCEHEKGRVYGGKVCAHILSDPADAYECSFVAVPAQREAGVRKHFAENAAQTIEKRLKEAAGSGEGLSPAETRQAEKMLEELRQKAFWGDRYRENLEENALRYGVLVLPEIPRETLKASFAGLTPEELNTVGTAFAGLAAEKLPIRPQLAPAEHGEEKRRDQEAFRI